MKEHILEFRKLIPSSLCKKIILYFGNDYEEGAIATGVNKEIRNCVKKSIFDASDTFGKKIVKNYLVSKLFEAFKIYQEKYPHAMMEHINQMEILKYESNEKKVGYDWHTDEGPRAQWRSFTFSICLNSDFEGGEFNFKSNDEVIQFPQGIGDCIIFPSNFIFPHKVNPVTRGTRHAIVAWGV